VAVPTLTSVHLRCLPATAPSGFEFVPETTLDHIPAPEWVFPLPFEQDAYLGTGISIGFDGFWSVFELDGDVELFDVTAGEDGVPVSITPEGDGPHYSTESLDFKPVQPLNPWSDYRAEAVVCVADSDMKAVFDCYAIAWSFSTRDLGLPLEPDAELPQVGFYIDMQNIENRHFDPGVAYLLEGVAHELDDIVFSLSTDADLSTTTISQDDPETSSVLADPCLVTIDLDGAWTDAPPEATIGPTAQRQVHLSSGDNYISPILQGGLGGCSPPCF